MEIPDREFATVRSSEHPLYKELSERFEDAEANARPSTSPLSVMASRACSGNPYAVRWLLLWLDAGGWLSTPTLDQRIAQVQSLYQGATVRDSLAIDEHLGRLLEEKRLKETSVSRSVEEMTRDSLAGLDKVLASGEKGEKRKAAQVILAHAINLAKQEKIAEIVMQAILPSIRRYSEELVRLAERRIPAEEIAQWREEAEEQLRQLLTSVGNVE
ncbi:MAG: hypothetical protein WC911_01800 [Thermoleophilia bacterium]